MSAEDRILELYGAPLNGFIAARNELAKALKDEGLDEGSTRVRGLTKPSVAAWAVNQLARTHADDIGELLSLRERLRSAGSPAELRKASTRRHQLISDLVEKAGGILEDGGHSPSGQTLAKVSATLYGGATDQELEELKTGTLTRELEASGFDGAAELDWDLPPSGTGRAASKKEEKARLEREQLQMELEEAERSARSLVREAKRARSAADAADGAAATATDRVKRLRGRLQRD